MVKRQLLALTLMLMMLPFAAYAHEGEHETLLIGTVTDEPEIFVGLLIEDDAVTLYICDGNAETNTISIGQWFMGAVEDDAIDITAANGNRVEVALDETAATGKFTFTDGTTKAFALVPAEGAASLFRSEFAFGEDEFVGGWLVLADGSVRGSILRKDTSELVPATLSSNIIAILIGRDGIVDGTSNTKK